MKESAKKLADYLKLESEDGVIGLSENKIYVYMFNKTRYLSIEKVEKWDDYDVEVVYVGQPIPLESK